jgi:hypothetical protein
MKDQEIIEGNKLIAEFASTECDGKYYLLKFLKSDYRTGWYTLENMQFHSSWDWLMPVCVKTADIVRKYIPIEKFNVNL